MVDDMTRGKNPTVEFPGGKCEPDDGSILYTALRELRQEVGLAEQPSGATVTIRVMWYLRKGVLVSYFVHIFKIEGLNPVLATEAALARVQHPSDDPSWKAWCECNRIREIPLASFKKTRVLRDTNENPVSNISGRWRRFLTNSASLRMMENFCRDPNVIPVVIPDGPTAYVWSPEDILPNKVI
jgi:8-oxo-dGTP pyrophosphatase MutT (NUDIX family)